MWQDGSEGTVARGGIHFEPNASSERERRVLDAIALNKPDRVPGIPRFGAFAPAYAGINRRDEVHDLEKR